jgi:hypothetical protein
LDQDTILGRIEFLEWQPLRFLKLIIHSSQSAAGGVVIFTYIDKRVPQSPGNFYGTKAVLRALKNAGENWTFGIDPSNISDFLNDREFYRIAVACVK